MLGAICLIVTSTTALGQQTRLPGQWMLNRFGLERAWWGQATLNAARDKVAFVSAEEELVFVQATSGMLTAFDAETGKHLWAVQLGRRDEPTQAPISHKEIVLSIVGLQLYALDRECPAPAPRSTTGKCISARSMAASLRTTSTRSTSSITRTACRNGRMSH
jgi:hypothetical protein